MAGSNDQFYAIWSAAKHRYADITGEDLDASSFPHPSSTEDLLRNLDVQNRDFKHFREKRETFFNVLEGMCKPIELVGNLAAGGAAMVFPPSTLCFGAAMHLIKAAHGVSASYDAIAELLESLKDFLVRLTVYNREDLPIELQEKLAEILGTLLEIFARSTKVIKSGSGGRVMQFAKNVLSGKDEKLPGLIAKLKNMTESEARLVSAETLTETRRSGRVVDNMSVTLTETNMAVQDGNVKIGQVTYGVHQMTVKQDEFRKEIRQEIGNVVAVLNESKSEAKSDKEKKHQDTAKAVLKPSVSPVDILVDITKKRVPGTGDWIRNEELFVSWVNQNNPVLWISGNPGSGKSYLSGNIISYLQEQHPQGVQDPSHTSIGYFFFKDSDPQTRSFHQALKDLAYQISQNDPVYAKHIDSHCQSPDDIKTIPSAWRKLFVDFFIKNEKVDSSVYLVVDGVDEAYEAERHLFLELLSDLKDIAAGDERGSRIHLVLVGRPQIVDDISEALETSVPTIHVDWRKNSADILHYVKNSIRKSRLLSRATKQLQEEIIETLARNANGMFIWVDLMMRELGRKTHASSIRASLHQAPKGLTEMLRHVLEGFSATLKEEDPEDLNTMLAWVTCACRALSLGELDTVLKLKSSEGDGVLYLEGKLRKQFASFFNLTREDGLSTADLQSDIRAKIVPDQDDVDAVDEEGLDDVDNETDFNSNLLTTDVLFCHASIGDFFRDEKQGKVSAGEGHPAVGVNIIEAKVSVLKTCLDLICDLSLSSKIEDSPSMQQYAVDYWHEHLQAAAGDLTKIKAPQKEQIGRLLAKMFRDETATKEWSSGKAWNFFTPEALKPLRQWLEDKDVLNVLSAEDQNWIKSTSQNPAETFVPAVKINAKEWLQGLYWLPNSCMTMIHVVTSLIRGELLETVPAILPLQAILDAAEWPQFEKNALWHRRLGMCLRDNEHYDEAMKHYEMASKMDDKMWLTPWGIARIYAQRHEIEKAIEQEKFVESIMQKLLEEQAMGKDTGTDEVGIAELSDCQEQLAKLYGELKCWAESLEYHRKAFTTWNRGYANVFKCLWILGREQEETDYEEIMGLIRSMEDNIPGTSYTRLTECLWENTWLSSDDSSSDFLMICAMAAKKTDQLAWLQGVYQVAINAAKKELKPLVAMSLETDLADLFWKYGGDQEKAARIWERVLRVTVTAGATDKWEIEYCQVMALKNYGPYCLQKALDAGKGTPEADRYIKKLERLCKQKASAAKDAAEIITTNRSAAFVGIWYRLNGESQKARAYFQPYIKEALMILSDDIVENDNIGYYDLAHVLLAAGDDVNALAALQVMRAEPSMVEVIGESPQAIGGEDSGQTTDEGTKEGVEAEEKPSTKAKEVIEAQQKTIVDSNDAVANKAVSNAQEASPEEETSTWYCDGPCGKGFPTYSYGNACRYCLVDFCKDCLKLLKEGATSEVHVCNPRHGWLHAPPMKSGIDLSKDEILVGDVVMGLGEFKDALRKEWQV